MLCVFEQKCFPLTVFPLSLPKMEESPSLSPGSSKYLGSSMQDTAAEERGRQRRDLDFPGEYSVGLDLRKQKENTGIAAVRQPESSLLEPPWFSYV